MGQSEFPGASRNPPVNISAERPDCICDAFIVCQDDDVGETRGLRNAPVDMFDHRQPVDFQ